MSKNFLIAVFTFATLGGVNAQANLLTAQKASDIGKRLAGRARPK